MNEKQDLQIARETKNFESSAVAKFFLGNALLCEAWWAVPNVRKLNIEQTWIGIEHASAVRVAIEMAIDWLVAQD